jgi:DNA-binding GntR family transcriptional regulator
VIVAIERGDADGAASAASDHVNLLGDRLADFIASLPPALTRAS